LQIGANNGDNDQVPLEMEMETPPANQDTPPGEGQWCIHGPADRIQYIVTYGSLYKPPLDPN